MWLPLVHPSLGTWPAAQTCALSGNRAGDPSVLRPVLNPLSHTSQGFLFHFKSFPLLSLSSFIFPSARSNLMLILSSVFHLRHGSVFVSRNLVGFFFNIFCVSPQCAQFFLQGFKHVGNSYNYFNVLVS